MEVGNKTYKCNLCSSRFSDITGIQDHLISSHREHLPEAEESEGEDLLDEEEEEGIRRFDGVEREEVLGRRGREVETRGERIEDMMIQDSTLQEEGGIVEQFGHIEQLWLDEDGDGELSEFEIYKGKLRQLRENDSKFSSKKEAYYIMYKQNTENASYQEYNTKIISSMNFIPKVFGQDFTRSLGTFSLGKRTLRKIQGKFGMAVYNYFKFLKWACTLNLVMAVFIFGVLTVSSYIVEEVPLIKHCNESTHMDVNDTSFYFPEYSDQCCSSNYLNQTNQGQLFNTTSAPAFFSSLQIFLQDLFQGSGWMVDSYFYYGKYAPGNKSERFQMDLAYWFIIFSCFLLSLVSTVWSSANSFQQSFKWNKFNNVQYFDLCFCNWDFCLDTIQAVQVKQDVLKNEARTALETDRMQALQDKRTRGQKLNLVLVRVICNLLVLCLLGGFIIGLYYAFIWVPLQLTELKCPTSDEILSEAGEMFDLVNLVKCFFIEYLTSIIITVANLALPILFNYIISMEKYSPKVDLLVNLMRSITLRIASLVLTIAAQYQLNNCDYACFDEVSNEITNSCSNSTLQACSNSNLDVTGLCKRGICWENSVGAQYFKLTLLDFIVQLVLMLVDLARSKCCACAGNISFDVTKHVLDIVYSQTICWMGLFFAPLLSLVTFIKFVIILFIKIIYIKSVCTPQNSFYQASRISSIFKYFLLLGFWVSVIPLSLFIGYTTPSNSCGPFRYHTEDGYYGVVLDKIKEINWAPAQNILYLLGQMTTLYLIFSGVLLLIYYYYAQATAQGDLCSRIEKELNQISMHKKMLVSRISEEKA